ncbi:MAG TPA: helix-turn-helix transcriptional regulator [Stellaceae bacterium]|nr:helix-turn-helix transcriptional regulator [Stellaceae bacterium]
MSHRHKIVEERGKRFVLVPEKTYDRMLEDLEDLEDIRAFDRAKAKRQESVPLEVVKRLVAGENPMRVWREYRKLTQQQLADKAGISKPYLSQLETGAREASVGVVRRLAAALRVDLDDLI